jgi:hypothetical protein
VRDVRNAVAQARANGDGIFATNACDASDLKPEYPFAHPILVDDDSLKWAGLKN